MNLEQCLFFPLFYCLSRAGTRSIIWISYFEEAAEACPELSRWNGSHVVFVETGNWDFGVHGSWLDAVKQFLPLTVNLEPGTWKQEPETRTKKRRVFRATYGFRQGNVPDNFNDILSIIGFVP